jgi:hypothetical protein
MGRTPGKGDGRMPWRGPGAVASVENSTNDVRSKPFARKLEVHP